MKISNKLLKPLSIIYSTIFVTVFYSLTTFALDNFSGGLEGGVNQARGQGVPGTLFGMSGIFSQIVNILLFVIGLLSVIMLIIGGFRYIISNGDSKAVEGAKNTILYAIIGLVVAILAYAIVHFVIKVFMTDGIGGGGVTPTNGVGPTNV